MTNSIKQVAERFGVGQHTVLAWVKSGELAAINVARRPGGKPHYRVTSDAIRAFELLRSSETAAPPPRRGRRRKKTDAIAFY